MYSERRLCIHVICVAVADKVPASHMDMISIDLLSFCLDTENVFYGIVTKP